MEINVTSSIVDNHAMPMCSIAASGSTAESHRRNTGVLLGSCMVASASDGFSGVCSVAGRVGVEHAYAVICGVCSVAGRVGVERFLEMRPWFCNLFLMKLIARNATRKDVDEPKELTSTNHAKHYNRPWLHALGRSYTNTYVWKPHRGYKVIDLECKANR